MSAIRSLCGSRGLAVAAVLIAGASPLHAQSSLARSNADEAQALLRAASTQSAIIVICAKHYAVDGTTALRISQTSRDVAEAVLGREQAAAAFKTELARRYDEVRETGEAQWCADQRVAMRDDGIGIFKE